MQITDHFKSEEFDCKDGNNGGVKINIELVKVLEDARLFFNAPIVVTSGIRNPAYNAKVGGAPKSQHIIGNAADIKVKGVEPKYVYEYFDKLYPSKFGIGLYKTFVHVDVRETKARWSK